MTSGAVAALNIDIDSAGAFDTAGHPSRVGDFTREVYGFLGVPIDVTSMRSVVHHIEMAAASATPLLISTTNVNFLASSRRNSEFRDSLLMQRYLHARRYADRLAQPLAGHSGERAGGWLRPVRPA